jgi:hypothetical protein
VRSGGERPYKETERDRDESSRRSGHSITSSARARIDVGIVSPRLGGLEIDDELECRRLLDRQVGRLGAVQDLSGVDAHPAPEIGADPLRIRIDATGYQTTSLRFSPCNKSVTTERRSSLTM